MILRTWARERHRSWNDGVRSVLAHLELQPEFDKFDTCLQPLVNELRATPPERRSLATILDAFYRFHGGTQGLAVERWGDKTPHNTNALPGIDRVFPDARYVHVLRDGADVVRSYVEAGRYATVEQAGLRWRHAVRTSKAFGRRVGRRFHEIRYEALVRDPATVVDELCGFLGLTFHEAMLDDLSGVDRMGDVTRMPHHESVRGPIRDTSVGRGRGGLTPDDRRRLSRVLDADLRRCGYEPLGRS